METPPLATKWFLDKTLWIAVLAPILGLLSKKLGLNLDPNEVVAMVLPIVTYIAFSKWKAAQLAKATIDGQAASGSVTSEAKAADVLRGK